MAAHKTQRGTEMVTSVIVNIVGGTDAQNTTAVTIGDVPHPTFQYRVYSSRSTLIKTLTVYQNLVVA